MSVKATLMSLGYEAVESLYLSTDNPTSYKFIDLETVMNPDGSVIFTYAYFSTSLFITYYSNKSSTTLRYGTSDRLGPYEGMRILKPKQMGVASIQLNNADANLAEIHFWVKTEEE